MRRTAYWIPTVGMPQFRDLEKESKGWSYDKFSRKDGLDIYNFLWEELWNYRQHGANGSIYEVGGVVISPGDIVVDAGANIGIWSNRAIFSGASQVFAFEPTLKSFNCLCENIDRQIVKPFCLALGDRREIVSMPVWENGDSVGSRIDGSASNTRYDSAMIVTLDDLFDIKLFDHIDYLKIDIEGAEDQVIYSLSRERLRRVKKISMEYHTNALTDSEEVIKYLRKNMFNHVFTLHIGDGSKIITFSK
jgi:FkbM family methyltransferase